MIVYILIDFNDGDDCIIDVFDSLPALKKRVYDYVPSFGLMFEEDFQKLSFDELADMVLDVRNNHFMEPCIVRKTVRCQK